MESEYAFGTHFALRVLVLPVTPIRKDEYARQLALLRQHSRIALADIPPSTTGEAVNSLLAPTPASRGFLNLNFVEAWDPESTWLEDFQVHRKVMGAIGLMDCAEWTGNGNSGDLQSATEAYRRIIANDAPPGLFAHRCYSFNPRDDQNDNAEGLVVIPNVGDLDFYINTLLAELTSSMLAGISRLMAALDSKTVVRIPTGAAIAFPQTVPYQNAAASASEQRLSLPPSGTPDRATSPGALRIPTRPPSVVHQSGSSSSIPETSDAKARKRHPGRIAKLRGDLYRLAGRISEAMNSYNESIAIARATNDHAWQAASMESNILTQIYQSWQHSNPTTSPSITPQSSSADLASLGTSQMPALNNPSLARELPTQYLHALNLFIRPASARGSANLNESASAMSTSVIASNTQDGDDVIHPQLVVESCLRCIRLQLVSILRKEAWDRNTVGLLVGFSEIVWPSLSRMEAFSRRLQTSISREDLDFAFQLAYSQLRSSSLKTRRRVRYLQSLCRICDFTHNRRRAGMLQREVAALSSLRELRKSSTTTQVAANAGSAEIVKSRPPAEDAQEILSVLDEACNTYSLPFKLQSSKTTKTASRTVLPNEDVMQLLSRPFHHFGWLELQHALVKEAIHIAENLPDYTAAVRYNVAALRETLEAVATSEQRQHTQNLPSLLSAAARHNVNLSRSYWGPEYLVTSISILDPSEPYKTTEQILASAPEVSGGMMSSHRDRMVHSVVRKASTSDAAPMLVQNEPAIFVAALTNTLSVPLRIEDIKLLCDGVNHVCSSETVELPPLATTEIHLVCQALDHGCLRIKGCAVRIPGCQAREFLLPSNAKQRCQAVIREHADATQQHVRLKSRSYDVWHEAKSILLSDIASQEVFEFLTCDVIPEQPLLILRNVNLVHMSVMLYNGESTNVQIMVENASNLVIDYFETAFEDNLTRDRRSQLSGDSLSPMQLYDLEKRLVDEPLLRVTPMQQNTPVSISPDAVYTLSVNCYGQTGLSEAGITLAYGHLQAVRESLPAPRFFTRHMRLPIAISVHPALECTSWKIVQLQNLPKRTRQSHKRNASVTSVGRALAIDEELEENLRDMDSNSSCLLVMQIRNCSTRQAFEAILEGKPSETSKLRQRIEPSSSANMLLPIKKIRLTDQEGKKPIPVLNEKQFVLGKNVTTPVERELFWYREELLKSVKLGWRETGSRRSGRCDLRHLPFTEKFCSMYRLDDLAILVDINEDGEPCHPDDQDHYRVTDGTFISIDPRFTNLLDRSITSIVSLVSTPEQGRQSQPPSSLSPFVALDGSQHISLAEVQPHQTSDNSATFTLSFLSSGSFSLTLIVEEHRGTPVPAIESKVVKVQRELHFIVS